MMSDTKLVIFLYRHSKNSQIRYMFYIIKYDKGTTEGIGHSGTAREKP